MIRTFDPYAAARSRARTRLHRLARAAALGGVSLGLLGPAMAQTPPEFAAAVENPFGLADIGGNAAAPALVDLDGDGDLDVLAGESMGTFAFFENTAGAGNTPAFATKQTNPFGLSDIGFFSFPSAVDLDGDGDLDVLAGERDGSFFYFENTAGAGNSPTFSSPQTNPFGLYDIGTYAAPSVDDLDGDGDLDVLAGELDGSFRYFENTAGPNDTPAFAVGGINPFGLSDIGQNAKPALGDFDLDGDLDVLSGGTGGDFYYIENTGTPTAPAFGAVGTDPFGLTDVGQWSSPAAADLDDDGDLDVLSGEVYGSFFYFENTADARIFPDFGTPQVDPFGLADLGSFSTASMADLDDDGDFDVLSWEYGGSIYYFENTGTATAPAFAPAQQDPFGVQPSSSYLKPLAADLDGDGDFDLLSGERFGSIYYFENTGSPAAPAFAGAQVNPFGLSKLPATSTASVGDLDDDGDLDVLAGDQIGSFYYFENTGTATAPAFAAPQTDPFGLTDIGVVSAPSLIDLDGDGDLDVLAGEYSGPFVYFENTGSVTVPAFAAARENPFGLVSIGPSPWPSVADLNNDGDLDVLSGQRDGSFVYFENGPPVTAIEPGAGEIAAAQLSAPAPNPVVGWTTVRLDVAERQRVQVTVVDVLGREVLAVFDGELAGETSLSINASELAAGVYLIRAGGETFVAGRPMTVLR